MALMFINHFSCFIQARNTLRNKCHSVGISALTFQMINLILILVIILASILIVILASILVFILISNLMFNLVFNLISTASFTLKFFLIINIIIKIKLIFLGFQIYYGLLLTYNTQSILKSVQFIFFIIIMGDDVLLYGDSVNMHCGCSVFI